MSQWRNIYTKFFFSFASFSMMMSLFSWRWAPERKIRMSILKPTEQNIHIVCTPLKFPGKFSKQGCALSSGYIIIIDIHAGYIMTLKALANEDTLLPTQMFPRLPARATFVADTNFVSGTQKRFLILFGNILCPQQSVLVCQGLKKNLKRGQAATRNKQHPTRKFAG